VAVKLTIPDLGDFADVEVIEIIASPGDVVAVEDPLITLETDKATMDVPAEAAGTIVSIDVKVGDRVSKGDALVTIEPADEASVDEPAIEEIEDTRKMSAPEIVAATQVTGDATHRAQLVVIGAGPGRFSRRRSRHGRHAGRAFTGPRGRMP
jgi:dihydrolipoamide dehydrogenase